MTRKTIQIGDELRVKIKNQSVLVIVVETEYKDEYPDGLLWADVVDDQDNKYRITSQEIEAIVL